VARDGQRLQPEPVGAMNGWAVVALALAIVSMLLALVPGIGFVLAVPGGAAASLMAFPALSRSERTGTGRGMAWWALGLGLLAMFVSYSAALLARAA
jgi:hypothetical protein